jgi:hypothetical protein
MIHRQDNDEPIKELFGLILIFTIILFLVESLSIIFG